MLDKIITIYSLIDDLLKGIGHQENSRREMSDIEIMTTALFQMPADHVWFFSASMIFL
ncbi:hypothetical protein [Trichormus variabilis]|uniref:Transposase DDE domain-containing protein n=1 Tax=Trichormus variabilis SAG 1403-4b TaxID=447716 RepID=A0A3S1AA64_ANAVA|nr:hypothetical protein [Trichormus variabilis]MBD2628065.1 hypothetical protein [Trichormus variabilis FACHB-164]RUS96788.1 hypothetical protein DSM107003_21940 [Trichormus variabilis SAG 1403-4b]